MTTLCGGEPSDEIKEMFKIRSRNRSV